MKILNLFVFFFGVSAGAFEFTPSVMSYNPSGRNATQKYTVHNTMATSTAVEIKATTREVDIDGKEVLKPTKDFTIYPKLFKMKPGETRVIKVTYTGEKQPQVEKSYRIVAEQLSVDLKKREAAKKNETNMAINFLYKYETSAYVTPENAEPKVAVETFKVSDSSLEVTFKNTGTAHQIFQNWQMIVETDKESVVIDKKNAPSLADFNLLAGNKVRVKIPWADKSRGTPRAVKFKLN